MEDRALLATIVSAIFHSPQVAAANLSTDCSGSYLDVSE